jgi:hypothetical protein
MTSTQRYLANHRNQFNGAILSANSVMPVADAVLSLPKARLGSAIAALSGTYTGQEESLFEVEMLDSSVTVPLISQPVFTGAGSGAISGISFAGTAQSFTVKLADLGQILTAAGTDLEGATIVARTPGAAGNAIYLHVDLSTLTYSATNFSLLRPLAAGSNGIEGAEYDWDTKVMGADDQIPALAHRIVFGEDTSTVYTQYKAYKDGKWLYHFEPAIKAEIPTGAKIRFVTGGRTITLSNGAITEPYASIVTLYDLLSALQTSSALVKVDGVVANDRAPGGMASRDLQTRTDAHCLPPTYEGSQFARGAMQAYYANANAATELVEARCWAVSSKDSPQAGTGRELWQIKGSVSGVVESAYQTGALYAGADFGFQIPVKLPDGFGVPRGRFSVTNISYVGRSGDPAPEAPPICVSSMALGPDAYDQQLTLVYTKRPSGECNCSAMPAPDLSGKKCLIGTTLTTTGGTDMDAPQIGRHSRMAAWHRDAVASNTLINSSGELRTAFNDVKLAGQARDAFTACLDDLYSTGTLGWAAWAATTAVTRYQIIQIGDDRLQVKIAGTTGATIPAVPGTVGGTVVDGTVTWVYLGKTPELMWDAAADSLETDWVVLSAMTDGGYEYEAVPELIPGLAVVAGTVYRLPAQGIIVRAMESATLGAGIGISSAYGQVGTITFIHTTDVGGIYVPPQISFLILSQSSEKTSATDIDTPEYKSGGTSALVDDFAQRYTASMDAIRAAAGISKKADASTVAGDGCWRDTGAQYWWTITGQNGAYAPAFSNEPYFSSRDAGAGYFSTHEFAFQLNIKCEASLLPGDTIQLSIGDAGWPSTYQVGDTIYLPIIAAQDLYLAGGKDGDNIQTWHIDGSITGAFPAYALDMDLPLPYNQSGLQFLLTPGGIPWEAGDMYQFTIEGGHYKWRKDGAAWSAPLAVGADALGSPLPPGEGLGVGDGLSLRWTTGAAPSFATGDLYKFRALQPYALSNAINPAIEAWRWSGASGILTANLGGIKTIDACALSFHTLPAGAVVTLQGGSDGVVWDWSESIPWRVATMAAIFAAHTATWLKLTITNAPDASIGWAWAGQAVSTEYSAECVLSRDYQIERSNGLNPAAAYLGHARSGSLEWITLRDPDMEQIMPMLDYLKQNDDQPMILIPQSTRPEEAYPVRVSVDQVEEVEDGGYQSNMGNERRYRMKWELKGVVG